LILLCDRSGTSSYKKSKACVTSGLALPAKGLTMVKAEAVPPARTTTGLNLMFSRFCPQVIAPQDFA
jgi:hypothetical protein